MITFLKMVTLAWAGSNSVECYESLAQSLQLQSCQRLVKILILPLVAAAQAQILVLLRLSGSCSTGGALQSEQASESLSHSGCYGWRGPTKSQAQAYTRT
jgi:hypothetical protein